MLWNGKIIGVVIGAIFGGPLGAGIGLAIGHLFDIGALNKILKHFGFARFANQAGNVQQIFFDSTFTIMGHLAKSDGRVSENEILAAKNIMSQLNLNSAMRKEAIELFNKGKQANFDINDALNELKHACWNRPSLLRTFIEIQLQMAFADGQRLSPQKHAAFQHICAQLGIHGFNFSHFQNRYRAEQNYQRYQQQPQHNPRQHLQDAYKILEISSTATDAEVKKAYRRQMSKNHPDKLVSKGLPPEMMKLATQKTQQIKDAYETIKQARNLK
ncbi:MAG: co-chaperone DjlA [Coxiellaceae bacterium]|nr:co-chaperone DjlA [Coxiellaceae bacterium]